MEESLFYVDQDYRSKLLKQFKFKEEEIETVIGSYGPSGFPASVKRYNLIWEVYDLTIEEPYYWILNFLKDNMPLIEKLEDSFAAAENSAFFGVTQQRLGAQQDKVSQFLATAGKMIKELFQMVRELRILDERLVYYDGSEKELDKELYKRGKEDEVTLKGIFVDLVQGGGKSAASIYGMAQSLEFITLPDLFFDAPPFKNKEELRKHMGSLSENFNENVLRVLVRHLNQFMTWKERTYKEHQVRRKFMLQYLLQHYEIIKMYINWVKPYLRHVAKLTFKEKNMSSPDIVSAFESSMLDVELLARKVDKKKNGCLLVNFSFRTRPEMKIAQEGYQRGPVHVGKFEMNLRVYGWTDKEVENYKKLKDKEAQMFMGSISSSVQSAMDALGKELEEYLKEAKISTGKEEKKSEDKSSEQKSIKKGLFESLLGDFYTPKQKKEEQEEAKQESVSSDDPLVKNALLFGHLAYRNFKKAHGLMEW